MILPVRYYFSQIGEFEDSDPQFFNRSASPSPGSSGQGSSSKAMIEESSPPSDYTTPSQAPSTTENASIDGPTSHPNFSPPVTIIHSPNGAWENVNKRGKSPSASSTRPAKKGFTFKFLQNLSLPSGKLGSCIKKIIGRKFHFMRHHGKGSTSVSEVGTRRDEEKLTKSPASGKTSPNDMFANKSNGPSDSR